MKNTNTKELELKLTDEEVRFTLEVLSQIPYAQVANLIKKIVSQVENDSI